MLPFEMYGRHSTKSQTPDRGVEICSTPEPCSYAQLRSSVYGDGTPRIESTPPTSVMRGSSQTTPTAHLKSSPPPPPRVLELPWGLKLESTPPPSSQLPTAVDLTPTPAPRVTPTPNVVSKPDWIKDLDYDTARHIINSDHGLPIISATSDLNAYLRWANTVQFAFVQGRLWGFIDGEYDKKSASRWWKAHNKRAVQEIYWACTRNNLRPTTAVSSEEIEGMSAAQLWKLLRSIHEEPITLEETPAHEESPVPKESTDHEDSPTRQEPPNRFSSTSSLPSLKEEAFRNDSRRVAFLLDAFSTAKLGENGLDTIGQFADQLLCIGANLERLGCGIPPSQLNVRFLYSLGTDFQSKLKELEGQYGDDLHKEHGVAFEDLRRAMVCEEARLKDEQETENVIQESFQLIEESNARHTKAAEEEKRRAEQEAEEQKRVAAAEKRLKTKSTQETPAVRDVSIAQRTSERARAQLAAVAARKEEQRCTVVSEQLGEQEDAEEEKSGTEDLRMNVQSQVPTESQRATEGNGGVILADPVLPPIQLGPEQYTTSTPLPLEPAADSEVDTTYSDFEERKKIIERARKEKKKKKEKKAERKREKAAAKARDVDGNSKGGKPRPNIEEINKQWSKDYPSSSQTIHMPERSPSCIRCKKSHTIGDSNCKWSPSVARPSDTGKIENVPFQRGPSVSFELKKDGTKEGQKKDGEERACENEENGELKEKKDKKHKKKRKRTGEDVGNEHSGKTLRTSMCAL